MDALAEVDGLVQEYLLFRGFTEAFTALRSSTQADPLRGFNVDSIVRHLDGRIRAFDMPGLLDTWLVLHERLFVRLDDASRALVSRLLLGLQRLYVIHAMRSRRPDLVRQFFAEFVSPPSKSKSKHGHAAAPASRQSLHRSATAPTRPSSTATSPPTAAGASVDGTGGSGGGVRASATPPSAGGFIGGAGGDGSGLRAARRDAWRRLTRAAAEDTDHSWRQWFSLPYCDDPRADPVFAPHFAPEWPAALMVTVRNVLSSVFHATPLPKLLAVNIAQRQQQALECELEAAHQERLRLRRDLLAAQRRIKELTAANSDISAALQSRRAQPQVGLDSLVFSAPRPGRGLFSPATPGAAPTRDSTAPAATPFRVPMASLVGGTDLSGHAEGAGESPMPSDSQQRPDDARGSGAVAESEADPTHDSEQ